MIINMTKQSEILKSLDERKPSQKQKLLGMLRDAGKDGVLNTTLVDVCIGYRSRIAEMYQVGYKIDVEHIEKGVCKYTLISEPSVERVVKPALDIIKDQINKKYDGAISTDDLLTLLYENNFNIVRKSGSHK